MTLTEKLDQRLKAASPFRVLCVGQCTACGGGHEPLYLYDDRLRCFSCIADEMLDEYDQ